MSFYLSLKSGEAKKNTYIAIQYYQGGKPVVERVWVIGL